ncbi:MAG: hypothetical protein ACKO5E_00360, partial [bacterium]
MISDKSGRMMTTRIENQFAKEFRMKTGIGWMLGMMFMAVAAIEAGAEVKITPDVVYGHKHGVALTFDVFTPTANKNGAAVLFMVSGGWYSSWNPPEQAQNNYKPLTDKGFTVIAVR